MRIGLFRQWFFVCLAMFTLLTKVTGQQKTGVPEWWNKLPSVKGKIASVGMGETKVDAVVDAIVELALTIKSEENIAIKDSTDAKSRESSRSFSDERIGNVRVDVIDKKFSEYTGDTTKILSGLFTRSSRITLLKGGDSLQIKSYSAEERSDSSTRRHVYLSIADENLSFNDLIRELRHAGIKMKTYETEEEYYILFLYPEPKN